MTELVNKKQQQQQQNTNQLSQLGKQLAKSFQAPFLDGLRAFLPDPDKGLHRYRLWTVPRGAQRLQRTAPTDLLIWQCLICHQCVEN